MNLTIYILFMDYPVEIDIKNYEEGINAHL